jgi:phage terminase large subunit GpA-like protein
MPQIRELLELNEFFRPPPAVPLSEWAEKYLVLSPDTPRPGPLRLFGWQRAIFDSFTDPLVEKIVIMCGTQLVKTLFIQAALAYVIAGKPGPILIVAPNDDDARTFSKDKLAPLVRDSEILRGKVFEPKSRDGSNTILHKQFTGGTLTLVGANAPSNLARRSIQYLFCDEVDKYPVSAGSEGDPIDLARERTVTYGSRRKIIEVCSPTIEGHSRIGKSYAESDRQKPYVPCWDCGHHQVLRWGQVRWDNTLSASDKKAQSAYYECEACSAHWNDAQRWDACEQADWRALGVFIGTRGYWISHLYSPWKTLSGMVLDFLVANKTPQSLQVFINTTLAEEWKERGETPDWKRLYDRREGYEIGVVPEGGLLLTGAVDVQADRLEFELKAWGPGKENWSVYYEVIQPTRIDSTGKPVVCRSSEPEPWMRLAELIEKDWPVAKGGTAAVRALAIDTGFSPERAYEFCRHYPQPAHGPAGSMVHSFRTVFPIKGGHSAVKLIETISDTDAARKRGGLKIVTVGTLAAKQEVYDALRLESPVDGQPFPPGYYHSPSYEAAYFQGLCAETRLVKSTGQIEWRKDGRNEPLDLAVYNRAAAAMCGIDAFTENEWETLKSLVEATRRPPPEIKAEQARERFIPKQNWFNR